MLVSRPVFYIDLGFRLPDFQEPRNSLYTRLQHCLIRTIKAIRLSCKDVAVKCDSVVSTRTWTVVA